MTYDFAEDVVPPQPTSTHEVILDKKTGQARQAGATTPEGAWIKTYREKMEGSLYAFAKGVLGKTYLTENLHLPVCRFLQKVPPQRKGVLLPREHGKTTIVSHSLPLHILIQPKARNIYFPGEDGAEQRIVLSGEVEGLMAKHLRVISAAFETNDVLRALWPHRCWDAPRRQSKKWNEREIIIPRENEWPEPSIQAIGVGGAITGAHPSVLIKDDLISLEAANSPVVMQTAIDWHIASRALINKPNALEFIIGTRWAVADLYEYIQTNDPTVEWIIRSIVEDQKPIWPEAFTLDKVAELQREFGVLFWLLYMNSAKNPHLTDFDLEQLRTYVIRGEWMEFEEDDRDMTLATRINAPATVEGPPPGTVLPRGGWQDLYQPGQGFRIRRE